MPSARVVNSEPLPGYRLLEPLGKGGFGEVWKCEAPGGLLKAIKFVTGCSDELDGPDGGATQELCALQHIKSIRHPFLLSMERVEMIDGDLVIVMELADRSLNDLLEQYRKASQVGIPRHQLLTFLREAAEVLDLMNLEFNLQHLDIKPRNLFLVGRHVKVADFGLVNRLTDSAHPEQRKLSALTPLYAAPETFLGRISTFSDQYSLAITYHELLTGTYPFDGKNFRQLALQHTGSPPDLSRLPAADQPIVRRALAKEPIQRYPSCTAFVEALELVSGSASSLPNGSSSPSEGRTPPTSSDINLGLLSMTSRGSNLRLNEGGHTVPTAREAEEPTRPTSGGLLPGYQFLECQVRTPGGEVWRAQDKQGVLCQVRLVNQPSPTPGQPDPVERLTAAWHRDLVDVEVVLAGPGRYAIICDASEQHLGTRFKACQAQGLPGIPRPELLGYFKVVAAALDTLAESYGLHHLALSPRHLILRDNRVALIDFGLAELFWIPNGVQPAALNSRYAALELFDGNVAPTSDQYSLAVLFQELLVGLHPFRNLNSRQMATPRLRGQPDLAMLPAHDRPALLRALLPDPKQRFPSCRAFVTALEEGSSQCTPAQTVSPTVLRTRVVRTIGQTKAGSPALEPLPPEEGWRPALDELLGALSRNYEIGAQGNLCFLTQPGKWIEHRCQARLLPGTIRLKMGGFRDHWHAEVRMRSENRWVYVVRIQGSFWERWFGWVPGIEVVMQLRAPRNETQVPLLIRLQTIDCRAGRAAQILNEMGGQLLLSLQTYLQTTSTREGQAAYPYTQPVQLLPCGEQNRLNRPVRGSVRDLSRTGATLLVPESPPGDILNVQLTRWASTQTLLIPGRVGSRHRTDAGQLEVEIDFVEQ